MEPGTRVLVTGATAGIGRAIALLLADRDCTVHAVGRRRQRLAEMEEHGIVPVRLDVSDRAAVEAVAQERPEVFDVDVLVNNAGLARGTDPMPEAALDDWDEMVRTNVQGLLYVTRLVLPGMVRRGRGDIVNLGSVAGRWVYPGGGVYCATKFAVRALSEGLRLDLQGSGVRVMNIEPGLVETEFSKVRFRGDVERAAKVYADTQPLTPDDVAETVLWCLERPRHVDVQELVLYPTDQAGVRDVVRR